MLEYVVIQNFTEFVNEMKDYGIITYACCNSGNHAKLTTDNVVYNKCYVQFNWNYTILENVVRHTIV